MAAVNHYDVGDVWNPNFIFKVGATPTDPTTVTFKVALPDGTIESVGPTSGAAPSGTSTHITGITRNSAGNYTLAISVDASGYWTSKAIGTGAATGTETQPAIVDPDPFTANGGLSSRALVGLGEMKDWLQYKNIDTDNDLEIVQTINSVSEAIHREARREFKVQGTNPQTRTFRITNRGQTQPRYIDGVWMGDYSDYNRTVRIGDMAAAPTQVQIIDFDWTTVDETVTAGNQTLIRDERDPVAGPIVAIYFQSTVTSLRPGMRVSVTGNFGFPSVPEEIKQVCKELVEYKLDRDVEHPRTDFNPQAAQTAEGATVVINQARPMILPMPPEQWATVVRWRDPVVG